ncbi:MAG: hypothetical protein IPI72_12250 [Flavobacteriales bacterium]|nr:hypothetical protein [Flavobacteriales bacterium]
MHYAYEYDAEVNTYVTKVSGAYGYHSTSVNEKYFGQLEKTTDINGQDTEYLIDDRGRVVKVTGPYELESGAPYTIQLSYFTDAPVPYSVVEHYDPEHPDHGIQTITFLDGFFRPIQVKKSAVISDGNGGAEEGFIVSGRVVFDAFGRQVETYYPREDDGATFTFNNGFNTVSPTRTAYDILDRETTITLPDGSATTMGFGFETPMPVAERWPKWRTDQWVTS